MNQGNFSGDLPKFHTAYFPGESGDDLELPISFNSCLSNSLPEYVTVISIYGNIWSMEMRKCAGDVEKYLLVDGWKRIVKDEDLKGGDHLIFEFDGSGCFNFCVFEHETQSKRLKSSSVQGKEIVVASAGEEETRGGDDVIVLDDDEEADDDVIVLDDDEADDDYVEADDDDDEADDDYVQADDDGDEADDDDVEADDDDDEADDDYVQADDERQYLDDRKNLYFTGNINGAKKNHLFIPLRFIKDHGLRFPDRITVVDKLGALERKITIQTDGITYARGFASIVRRSEIKSSDKLIFELKRTATDLIHTIKVHIISK